MKKKFKMVDLDCANCAAKMEDAIKKIDGVNDATVSFMMQKLTIDADDARFDEIMQEVVAVCKKVEPDCQISAVKRKRYERGEASMMKKQKIMLYPYYRSGSLFMFLFLYWNIWENWNFSPKFRCSFCYL